MNDGGPAFVLASMGLFLLWILVLVGVYCL
jgi:hypothetical protein